MYNSLISAGAAIAVMLILFFGFDMAWWGALMVALAVMAGVLFLLMRNSMQKLTDLFEAAGKDLQAQRFEKAVRDLKDAKKLGKWQFFIDSQINSQIGMIYYMKRDFSNAFPYLQDSFFKNWVSLAMLAICYMKRQKKDLMVDTFEKAVKWSPKEPLLWGIYAYCLNECGEVTKAKEILEKGIKKLPSDLNLKANLENLSQGKKMKMREYGDMWFQFHLESMAALQKHQMSTMGGRMKHRATARR
jgi:tetratricopeptide (TPR) repeat protein